MCLRQKQLAVWHTAAQVQAAAVDAGGQGGLLLLGCLHAHRHAASGCAVVSGRKEQHEKS